MRSRYSAFVRGDLDYIERTLAPEVQREFNRRALEEMVGGVRWLDLEVRETVAGGAVDSTGSVEFVARFIKDGNRHLHHERASFRRADGRWVYVDGEINPRGTPRRTEKVGRNEPCPCGSGRKYKKCCGAAAV